MRTVAVLILGMILGAVLLFAITEVAISRYSYFTVSKSECEAIPPTGAQVVPHQPNPCHFRRPRWTLLR